MIKITPTSPDDVRLAYTIKKDVYDGEYDLLQNTLDAVHNGSPMRSLWNDDDLIGIMGLNMKHTGVAEVHAIFTPLLDKCPISFARIVRRYVEASMISNPDLHRMEMLVKLDYTVGHRFAESLGFQCEGVLRQYGSDRSDYAIYGRVR